MKKMLKALTAAMIAALSITSSATAAPDRDPRFYELGLSVGGWKGDETKGVFAMGEGMVWIPQARHQAMNLGIGALAHLDKGWGQGSVDWGFTGVGIEAGLWKYFEWSDQDASFLLKPRLVYRSYDQDWMDDGLVPGIYAELNRVMSRNDLATLMFDAWFVKDDSYANIKGIWEHRFAPGWRWRLGAGAVMHETSEEVNWGFSGLAGVKYMNTHGLNLSLDTSEGGPFYSAVYTYEWLSNRAETSMLKKGGEK